MKRFLSLSLLLAAAAAHGPASAQAPRVEKAVIKKKPTPLCTEEAKSNRAVGLVVLRAVLSKTGEVTDVRIVQEQPYGLTESAVKASRKIKFVPAKKDGQPVSQWLTLEYNFNCSG